MRHKMRYKMKLYAKRINKSKNTKKKENIFVFNVLLKWILKKELFKIKIRVFIR